MALPNLLALTLSTVSLANGFADTFQQIAFLMPNPRSTKERNEKATPLDTFQKYILNYATLNTYYHLTVHGGIIASFVWSLLTIEKTRSISSIGLAFDIGSLVMAFWVAPILGQIDQAKSISEVRSSLKELMRRQGVRMALTQLPCVISCLFALAE